MSDWLRFILGLDKSEAATGDETIWEFSGMPQGDAFFFSIVIVTPPTGQPTPALSSSFKNG